MNTAWTADLHHVGQTNVNFLLSKLSVNVSKISPKILTVNLKRSLIEMKFGLKSKSLKNRKKINEIKKIRTK